jgi:hypothetical protein
MIGVIPRGNIMITGIMEWDHGAGTKSGDEERGGSGAGGVRRGVW